MDLDKVQRFIDKVNKVGRFNLQGSPIECLKKLKYISDKKVTHAAVLLFAKEGSVYNVHLGRFKTPSMIIDDKMLRLTLFEAVEETQKYLISQMKVAFEITGVTTQRTEILEYPLPAIRELILNCLIHRDYLSPIDVQIKIFDHYITFYNPGKLYGDLTVDDLKTDNYQANTRNKLIAEAFYLTGDIEKYGSGFRRIRREIEQYPTMKFDYQEIANGFLATVSYSKQKTTTIEQKGSEKTVGKTVEKTVEKIKNIIADNPYITQEEIVKITGLSRRGVEWNIAKLKTQGLIERIGPDNGGYWEIVK
ncbi:winged helix-turn-helix transcriptional regulator [Bacteroidales bacterium OttesenSCG-928-B11]|nr:winged helix-turn-helix transcriptional regulator [Bacteroidales bacterium OttesenSCG-928-E04]MDL2309145.1 winged helix-turn-helix transcriptional regulator [Bacteroidales bacterium OttesenSCG-928-C03]MDL2312239.1 winged helix-turn-helix transcriptional regulator [Bacteroidales bacterium OttesenSCG-928-B11]